MKYEPIVQGELGKKILIFFTYLIIDVDRNVAGRERGVGGGERRGVIVDRKISGR